MLTNAKISQYSPHSEESDDQPLDFSKSSISAIDIKRESNRSRRHSTPSPDGARGRTRTGPSPANCFTTPSPSPPEHTANSHTNQVLCQLLTGNLIPTSTGKLMAPAISAKNIANPLLLQNESALHLNGQTVPSPEALSATSPPNASLLQVLNERHNSSRSPTGSTSPIGLGPLNQVDMHFAHSPNATGVDRFGTSGGLLTTAPAAGVYAANDSAKRALKYSRPFKAYPRDPLSIPMNYYGVGLQVPLTADAIATQSLLATASDQAYLQFREQMLINRRTTQEPTPRRNGQQSGLTPKSNGPNVCDAVSAHTNGNSGTNGNNSQNYIKESVSPSSNQSVSKLNGSVAAMTPISRSETSAQINSDETLDYSNGHSSGNSSSGEADVGSMSSTTGAHSGRHSDDGHSSMRKRGRPLPEDLKDEAYWERRRKNNEAAKRSRDARRAKEDEIAIRAAFLEQENLKLRCEIAQLKTETTKLRCLLYNS